MRCAFDNCNCVTIVIIFCKTIWFWFELLLSIYWQNAICHVNIDFSRNWPISHMLSILTKIVIKGRAYMSRFFFHCIYLFIYFFLQWLAINMVLATVLVEQNHLVPSYELRYFFKAEVCNMCFMWHVQTLPSLFTIPTSLLSVIN